jgi:hypothetical protein
VKRFVGVVLVCCMLATTQLAAQADFSDLNARPGDTVYVTEPSGTQVTGQLTSLSPWSLTIDRYQFKPAIGLRIERRGDPIWDGAVIGLAAGVGLGALTAAGECGIDRGAWACTLAGAGWLGLIGALIDWQRVGRTSIYFGGNLVPQPGPTVPGQGSPPGAASIRLRLQF